MTGSSVGLVSVSSGNSRIGEILTGAGSATCSELTPVTELFQSEKSSKELVSSWTSRTGLLSGETLSKSEKNLQVQVKSLQ